MACRGERSAVETFNWLNRVDSLTPNAFDTFCSSPYSEIGILPGIDRSAFSLGTVEESDSDDASRAIIAPVSIDGLERSDAKPRLVLKIGTTEFSALVAVASPGDSPVGRGNGR